MLTASICTGLGTSLGMFLAGSGQEISSAVKKRPGVDVGQLCRPMLLGLQLRATRQMTCMCVPEMMARSWGCCFVGTSSCVSTLESRTYFIQGGLHAMSEWKGQEFHHHVVAAGDLAKYRML